MPTHNRTMDWVSALTQPPPPPPTPARRTDTYFCHECQVWVDAHHRHRHQLYPVHAPRVRYECMEVLEYCTCAYCRPHVVVPALVPVPVYTIPVSVPMVPVVERREVVEHRYRVGIYHHHRHRQGDDFGRREINEIEDAEDVDGGQTSSAKSKDRVSKDSKREMRWVAEQVEAKSMRSRADGVNREDGEKAWGGGSAKSGSSGKGSVARESVRSGGKDGGGGGSVVRSDSSRKSG